MVLKFLAVGFLLNFGGCAITHVHEHELDRYGKVYYLDGAGGGSKLTDWGRGVRAGLKAGGYPGGFENRSWQTGFGIVADQNTSNKYKRKKAREVAAEIVAYMDSHPGAAVNLMGLSAGTAVAVYALEELPLTHRVSNVVLLGSSLSKHYDLSNALAKVRDKFYVLTSKKDKMLRFAVAIAGTADRKFCGPCSAGIKGFHKPRDATASQKRLYAKVKDIAWRKEFASADNAGGHTGGTNARFVEKYIGLCL